MGFSNLFILPILIHIMCPKPVQAKPAKPRKTFRQRMRDLAFKTALVGTAGVATFTVAGKAANVYKDRVPPATRPAVAAFADTYNRTIGGVPAKMKSAGRGAAEKAKAAKVVMGQKASQITQGTKREVNGLVKTFGWALFYRGLGAAIGAITMSSILGSRRRRVVRTEGGVSVSDERVHEGVGGKVKKYVVGAGAVGGAAYPPLAFGAGALRVGQLAWQGMSIRQKEKALHAMSTAAQATTKAAQQAAEAAKNARRKP